MPRTRTAALVTVVGVSAAATFAFAGPASAHVRVTSLDATRGGYAVMTFRMPNEEADASTTKLQVQFPTDTPLSFVATQPVAGWTVTQTKTKLATPVKTEDGDITEAVSQVTWTATGSAAVKPGEFQQFNVQAGPLPKKSAVFFPAIQTYSNGKVVKWTQRPAPGSTEEPQYPAPELELAAEGSTGTAHGGSSSAAPSVTASEVASSSSDEGGSNTGPIVLSIIALVLAAGALGLAVVNRARRSA